MITIGFCTREHNEDYIDHLYETCGLEEHKIEVIEIVNDGSRSLSECYNEILKTAKNDIIVLCHDDLVIETPNFGNKLIKHFNRNPEYGIIGVAGTRHLLSGQWWQDKRAMMGIVNHKHEGKQWTSKYSEDIGNKINDAIVLDGVFFCVNRQQLKQNFDERFNGFHFYDIPFCLKNYIEGVKIGVFTDIRITHSSIGMTNEKWEENKILFEKLYGGHLPIKIKKTYGKNDKIKVLIGCLNFNSYTGSELHFYELAKELVKQNCDVTICSNLIGGDLAKRASTFGIKLYSPNEPPGYKLGDGKWLLKTPNGDVPSKEKTLYAIAPTNFDILHLSHTPMVEHLMRLYPDVPVISTIHSEVIELEHPVINDKIKKYIAIRPEIKEFMINQFNISEDKIEVIYNPVDTNKFRPISMKKRDKKRLLFVGTMDYLRENTIKDLIEDTKTRGYELHLVGKNNGINIEALLTGQDHVKHFPPTWHVEKHIQDCDETAGILLGRSTIESWLCGKPAWIYDIDGQGSINSKTYHEVPNDINKFASNNVAQQTIEQYKEIIS